MKVSFTQKKLQNSSKQQNKKVRNILTSAFSILLLFFFTFTTYAQNNILVKGRITNKKGEPLPRASIVFKDGATGVSSNDNGDFEINAPANGTLIFSSVGFTSREIKVNNQTSLTVSLVAADNQMEQVVVVGYGTQKKKDVTGSVTSVNEAALREVPVSNLQGALQGRAAGLEVQTVGTTPGSGAQIRIRGTRSISGSNDPLLVLDGIPYNGGLNDINPDDVASIDILKDASATAIYGSRGANGVILVTTKRGRTGDTRVSFNTYYGIGTVARKYPVYNAQEYKAMRDISPWGLGYMAEEKANMAAGRTTDWQDVMYQNSYKTDNNISVSGGNNGNSFSLGAGYYKETTVLPGQDFTRYSLRGTIDSKIGNRIKVGLNTINTVGVSNGSQFVNNMFPVLSLSPYMTPYDTAGKLVVSPTGDNDDRQTQYNPVLLKNNNNQWVDKVRRLRTFNSVYGELQIITGLKYRLNVGLSYAQEEDDQFKAADDFPLSIAPSYFRPKAGNTAYINNGETWGYTVENILTYDKTFKKHRINFTGLYSAEEYHSHNTSVSKDSITDNFVQFYNLALSNPTPAPSVGGSEATYGLLSYMARINYAFDDRFLLTLTGRADGSSRLAPGHKWHYYPAVSAGWNLTNENFIKHVNAISNLKLRVGFGQTSNQAVGIYSTEGLVNNSNGLSPNANPTTRYNFGSTVVTGYNVVTLPNPNLDWEYTKTLNVGLDFGLLKNRITGSVDYYHQHTNKILYGVNLPVTSGVAGAYTTNIGEMENKGFEFSITTINVQSKNGFNWSTDLNLFFNKNKLLALSPGITKNVGNQLFVGYSMTSIYDYKNLGVWQLSEAADAAKYGAAPGQIKLADVNGVDATGKLTGVPDGKIDANDQYVIGDADAKLQGGMTNRFSFKGFDLSIVTYARFGGLLVSQIHQQVASYLVIQDGKRNGIKVDYWTPTNPSNWFPNPSAQSANGTLAWSSISSAWTTLGYYSATFVKIRSINLGYTFTPSLLKRVGAYSIRLYGSVDNVATFFSPYLDKTGIDPTGTNIGNAGVQTPGNLRGGTNGVITISTSTPQTRNFVLGLNVTF